jgi:hypothetical protein
MEHKVYVFILSKEFSEKFLILIRIERDMITNVNRTLCKLPFILVRF